MIMADGKSVTAADLDLQAEARAGDDGCRSTCAPAREIADRKAIRQAMSRTDNNISGAAKLLGISRPDALRPAQAISSASVSAASTDGLAAAAARR